MTGTEEGLLRVLVVDEDECIGCRACSNLWPEISAAVGLSDRGAKRTIRFPSFLEEFEARIAEALAEACPTGAITFGLADELPGEDSLALTFEMVRCRICGRPFATKKEMEYIRDRLPEPVQARGSAASWMDLCTGCRQAVGRNAAARELIVARSWARR
jgi:ferredoxin